MMTEWHGWRCRDSDDALHVGQLPGRKSFALYVEYPGKVEILAYFRTEGRARRALELIDKLTEGGKH